MDLYPSVELFRQLKLREVMYRNADCPGCESVSRGLVEGFAGNPDIASVWSCDGHAEDGKRLLEPYHMFVVKNAFGLETLMAFHQKLFTNLATKCQSFKEYWFVDLKYTVRQYPPLAEMTFADRYPVMVLTADVRTPARLAVYQQTLSETIEEVFNDGATGANP